MTESSIKLLTHLRPDGGFKVGVMRYEWTSHSTAGTVSNRLDSAGGLITKIVTNPDGTDTPTDQYDITLLDADSQDVALGTLANRDDTDTETVYPTVEGSAGNFTDVRACFSGTLLLTIAAAGNSKKGVIAIYYGV